MNSEKIGTRVKKYREQKSLKLSELASRSGLDEAFLQAVEEHNVYPSLGPLLMPHAQTTAKQASRVRSTPNKLLTDSSAKS